MVENRRKKKLWVELRQGGFFFRFNNENLVYWILSWIENSKTIEIETNLFPNFFFSFFDVSIFETKWDQQPGLFARITRFNAFENVGTRWNDDEKKERKGRKNLLKQRISSPPHVFPRTIRGEDPGPFNSQQICPDSSPLPSRVSSSRWKVGERVVPWMRTEPFWERGVGDGTSLDEKPARKKWFQKGGGSGGVKSREGWSALNYESTGTTLGEDELSPE